MHIMLMIRLQRVGRVNQPVFRVVVTDSKNGPKSGKFLEVLGSFDSRKENDLKNININQVKHWISKGAKLSSTLHNFFVGKGVIEGKKINKLPKKTPIKKPEEKKDASKEATPSAEAVVPKAE